MPYASLERYTRPLKDKNRWPSRSRRELLASDLGSLLNALIGNQPSDAAETDDLLRALEYASSWPSTAPQRPRLGEGTWGEMLDALIENAPSVEEAYSRPALPPGTEVRMLPNKIHGCLNPLNIELIWLDQHGRPEHIDLYWPKTIELIQRSRPHGMAYGLIRTSILHPEMILIAGELLRDTPSLPPAPSASSPSLPIPAAVPDVTDERII